MKRTKDDEQLNEDPSEADDLLSVDMEVDVISETSLPVDDAAGDTSVPGDDFSLSNLPVLTDPAIPDDQTVDSTQNRPGEESSGLIDIRSLSSAISSTKKARDESDLISLETSAFSPVLSEPKHWLSSKTKIWIAAAGVVFLAGLIAVFAVVMSGDDEDDALVSKIAMIQEQITEIQQTGLPGDTVKTDTLEEDLPVRDQANEAAEATASDQAAAVGEKPKPEDENKSSKTKKNSVPRSRNSTSKGSGQTNSSAGSAAPPRQKGGDKLDDLLGGSLAKPKKRRTKTKSASSHSSKSSSEVKDKLDRNDVQRGMGAVSRRVKACARGQRGTVTMKVIIGKTGRVISAAATGPFAGTPAGSCAARAVRTAKFPKTKKNLTVRYPFRL
ncbi:MAG: hypothetical protein GY847_16205 [Proteobacteria bacterium]|nr:hypothetical protein [Pseudomonadota bacterium]